MENQIKRNDQISVMVCHNCCLIATKCFKYRRIAVENDKLLRAASGEMQNTPPVQELDEVLALQQSIIKKLECSTIAKLNSDMRNVDNMSLTDLDTIVDDCVQESAEDAAVKTCEQTTISQTTPHSVNEVETSASKVACEAEEMQDALSVFKKKCPGVAVVKISSKVASAKCSDGMNDGASNDTQDESRDVIQDDVSDGIQDDASDGIQDEAFPSLEGNETDNSTEMEDLHLEIEPDESGCHNDESGGEFDSEVDDSECENDENDSRITPDNTDSECSNNTAGEELETQTQDHPGETDALCNTEPVETNLTLSLNSDKQNEEERHDLDGEENGGEKLEEELISRINNESEATSRQTIDEDNQSGVEHNQYHDDEHQDEENLERSRNRREKIGQASYYADTDYLPSDDSENNVQVSKSKRRRISSSSDSSYMGESECEGFLPRKLKRQKRKAMMKAKKLTRKRRSSSVYDSDSPCRFTEEDAKYCSYCDHMFYTRSALRNHERVHLKCMVCYKVCASSEALESHQQNVCFKYLEQDLPHLRLVRVNEDATIVSLYKDAFDYYIEAAARGEYNLDEDGNRLEPVDISNVFYHTEEDIASEKIFIMKAFENNINKKDPIVARNKACQTRRSNDCVSCNKGNNIVIRDMYFDLKWYIIPIQIVIKQKPSAEISYTPRTAVNRIVDSWSDVKPMNLVVEPKTAYSDSNLYPVRKLQPVATNNTISSSNNNNRVQSFTEYATTVLNESTQNGISSTEGGNLLRSCLSSNSKSITLEGILSKAAVISKTNQTKCKQFKTMPRAPQLRQVLTTIAPPRQMIPSLNNGLGQSSIRPPPSQRMQLRPLTPKVPQKSNVQVLKGSVPKVSTESSVPVTSNNLLNSRLRAGGGIIKQWKVAANSTGQVGNNQNGVQYTTAGNVLYLQNLSTQVKANSKQNAPIILNHFNNGINRSVRFATPSNAASNTNSTINTSLIAYAPNYQDTNSQPQGNHHHQNYNVNYSAVGGLFADLPSTNAGMGQQQQHDQMVDIKQPLPDLTQHLQPLSQPNISHSLPRNANLALPANMNQNLPHQYGRDANQASSVNIPVAYPGDIVPPPLAPLRQMNSNSPAMGSNASPMSGSVSSSVPPGGYSFTSYNGGYNNGFAPTYMQPQTYAQTTYANSSYVNEFHPYSTSKPIFNSLNHHQQQQQQQQHQQQQQQHQQQQQQHQQQQHQQQQQGQVGVQHAAAGQAKMFIRVKQPWELNS